MRQLTRLSFGVVLFCAVRSLAFSAIEFTGVFATAEKERYFLTDPVAGGARWVQVGGVFGGYSLSGYDAKTEEIILLKDNVSTRVRLKASTIKQEHISVSGEIKVGRNQSIAVRLATLVFGQESSFPINDGQTLRLKVERRPDGNVLYRAAVDQLGADGKTETLAAPSIVARPGTEFALVVGDFSFSFKPQASAP